MLLSSVIAVLQTQVPTPFITACLDRLFTKHAAHIMYAYISVPLFVYVEAPSNFLKSSSYIMHIFYQLTLAQDTPTRTSTCCGFVARLRDTF